MLLLCTANQCRSPMAEALLRQHLDRAGIDAEVSSAGIYQGGVPAAAHGVATMGQRGLDLSAHRSRQMDRALLDQADLVVGMAREHVREVAVLDPPALSKTFTLKELVRAGEVAGPRRPDEPLGTWLRRVAEGRRTEVHVGVGHDEDLDVEDPIGRSRDAYEATAEELDRLLGRLVELVWPSPAMGQERSA